MEFLDLDKGLSYLVRLVNLIRTYVSYKRIINNISIVNSLSYARTVERCLPPSQDHSSTSSYANVSGKNNVTTMRDVPYAPTCNKIIRIVAYLLIY